MYIRFDPKPNPPQFDYTTERCHRCDGHWKCYCEDEFHITISSTEARLIYEALKRNIADPKEQLALLATVHEGEAHTIKNFLTGLEESSKWKHMEYKND